MSRFAASSKFLLLALLLGAGPLYAADLDQAKRDGLVGETLEGYVAVVDDSAPAEVKALVEDINTRRQAEYRRIARSNDLELSQVEALAAKKAIEKTQPGYWVRLNGEWQRK